jgi:hypothetical protein
VSRRALGHVVELGDVIPATPAEAIGAALVAVLIVWALDALVRRAQERP